MRERVMWWWWWSVVLVVDVVVEEARGAVIPPPWVNQTTNPCASKSWQLLYWQQDGSCHHIFTQGPCGETQEFYYDVGMGRGRCRCPRGSLYHTHTHRCYPHYSRGPCLPRQYLDHMQIKDVEVKASQKSEREREVRKMREAEKRIGEEETVMVEMTRKVVGEEVVLMEMNRKTQNEEMMEMKRQMAEEEEEMMMEMKRKMEEEGECREFERCPPGQVFWPPSKTCHQYHTRGPCLNGALIFINPDTGMPECGCERSIMFSNYWPLTGLCFELFQKGPCPHGHIFLYNATRGMTECGCSENLLTNYHTDTDGCYELDQQGPCAPGHVFTFQPSSMAAQCTCRPGHAFHPVTGACYQLYSRGPCQKGQFFTPSPPGNTTGEKEGQCRPYPCSGPRRYHPLTDTCNRLGWRGPCSDGRLFIYHEDAPLVGECGCLEELAGYWRGDGRCYEVGSRGPCPPGHVLAYRKSAATSFCACDIRKGFVKWEDGQCYRQNTQGPCQSGQVLVASRGSQSTPSCTNLAPVTESPHHRINSVLEARHLHHNTTALPTDIITTTTSTTSRRRGSNGDAPGRSGRSMADSEVWGSLDSLLPSGHYFTGRPDGRRGLTPWWGTQSAPPHTQPSPG